MPRDAHVEKANFDALFHLTGWLMKNWGGRTSLVGDYPHYLAARKLTVAENVLNLKE